MSAISDIVFLYLQWINRFETLTTRQLMRRLGYMDTSYTTVTERLKDMAERELLVVEAKIQDNTKKITGATKVYGIGPEGKKILEAAGITVPRKNATRTAEYFRHSMAVIDVLITILLCVEQTYLEDRSRLRYTITNFLTEYDVQRLKQTEPIVMYLPNGEQSRVEPDAIVTIVDNLTHQKRTFVFEVEMGQLKQRAYSQIRWHEKLEKLIAFWEAEPDREEIYFVVIAIRGKEQLLTLQQWTKQYLQEQGKEYLAPFIRMSATKQLNIAVLTELLT